MAKFAQMRSEHHLGAALVTEADGRLAGIVTEDEVAARLLGKMRAPAEEKLSARELEVLGLVAEGASNGAIAQALHISEATVKSHLLHIFAKLGVADRTAAVTVAVQRGILRLG
jgi:ATP/maltotriose-dependent transcriptional regulator MalT